jgi:hypothetical protein
MCLKICEWPYVDGRITSVSKKIMKINSMKIISSLPHTWWQLCLISKYFCELSKVRVYSRA